MQRICGLWAMWVAARRRGGIIVCLMPLFSIIVVHYQGSVAHDIFLRGIASLQAQTFTDYEILCYHDGPLLEPDVKMPLPVRCTEQRFNDWGHSLRDRGIGEAAGDYIIHFNADNLLYPNALEEIAREINRPPRLKSPETGESIDTNEIVIFPVIMIGLQRIFGRIVAQKKHGQRDFYEIMTGNPPILQNIDCMQLVMRRDLWLAEGGWQDKSEMGDGAMYERFAEKYPYRTVGPVLGEHH